MSKQKTMVGMLVALVPCLQRRKRSSEAMKGARVSLRRKEENLVMPEIPLDILIEILIRLPAKSLMRLKCVSKLWFSLIRSRFFSNRFYLTAASPPRRRLYMSLMKHLNCDSMEVCHNPGKSFLLSFSSSSLPGNSAESLDLDLIMPGMGGYYMVALRGLLLYSVCRKACIYNPATRQSITLPAVKSDIFAQEDPHKQVLYSFGHDPLLDQYKVVCHVVLFSEGYERMTSEYWVFVVQAGGFWKRIEFNGQPHSPTRAGVCINGVIYYLACSRVSRDILISFDVRSEEFNMIQAPYALSESDRLYVGFIEYAGKPTIIDRTHLWVLEDVGKWSSKPMFLQPCQMHLVVDDNGTTDKMKVHGTTQNGEVIMAPIPWRNYVLYHDVQKNDLRKVNIITGDWVREFGMLYIDFKHMDKSESIMHLET